MATVILVRHGRTAANASGVLAGRTPGVRLDDVGTGQAAITAERIAALRPVAVVSSPLERCQQTASHIADAQSEPIEVTTHDGLVEVDYGDWQGAELKRLMGEDLWKTVQRQPSAVCFPGGETMLGMQARAVDAIRTHDAELAAAHGERAVWVAVSHGDIIKSILADAYGMHLDQFQRIVVDPASISIVRYTSARPYVLSANTHGGDLAWLNPPEPAEDGGTVGKNGSPDGPKTPDDAVLGGGAGPA